MSKKKPPAGNAPDTGEKQKTAAGTGLRFEEALKRLEEIVGRLEEGSVTLDEVLKLYEEGMLLSRTCMGRVEEAELKVKRLMKDISGKFELTDGLDE